MRIGIIGAGQLGQMLGFAARELGHSCFFLDPSEFRHRSTIESLSRYSPTNAMS